MPELAAHLERVAKAAYDEWEAWHSEPCEQGQFEGKKYVSYPDMGSLGSEQKFVEVVAAALAACAREASKEAFEEAAKVVDGLQDSAVRRRMARLIRERAAGEKGRA